jgi:elongation factor G
MKESSPKDDGTFVITVEAPLANMFGYSSEIRSVTQGQGEFSMEFLRYDSVNEGQAQMLRDEYNDREDH